MKTRSDLFPVERASIRRRLSRRRSLISQITGYPVQPNKAVVGAKRWLPTESGIHRNGVLKHRETYEIMRPRMSAGRRTSWCWASIRDATPKTRLPCRTGCRAAEREALNAAFARFCKELADKKHEISDEDPGTGFDET